MAAELFVATLETSGFRFMTAGSSEQEARDVMKAAWHAHRTQTGATWTFDDLADDVNVVAMRPWTALRDGSPMNLGSVTYFRKARRQ
ncbi:hypothetical protein SAMN05421837_107313 [Amycolatopsis pretoriensis]|uniref:Uncharacterized protein n=1 Tax=Amycolatopsis pretoriensis TaxID=218821 RepID=A0A1H5R7F7_9PSEU|nr:hypothetical protein [Amycolatopsis pretoriensis]SEF34305.1 hypothetical protein SAMN05421837_107313 [Amycolatopsis pretoriensis]